MAYDDVNDVVDELFESLLSRYQTDFIFDFVQLFITNVTRYILNVGNRI